MQKYHHQHNDDVIVSFPQIKIHTCRAKTGLPNTLIPANHLLQTELKLLYMEETSGPSFTNLQPK